MAAYSGYYENEFCYCFRLARSGIDRRLVGIAPSFIIQMFRPLFISVRAKAFLFKESVSARTYINYSII